MKNDKTWKISHYLNGVAKVSRIDLQEGELYAQHYDQRKELGRSLNILRKSTQQNICENS